MIDTIIIIFVILSLFFSIVGVIGLFRLPDVYTRLHAAGMVGSLGLLFAGLAVLIYAAGLWLAGDGAWLNFGTHVILALIVVLISSTTSTHAIARSAYRSGIKPKNALTDALNNDLPKMEEQEEKRK